jgi:SEC-C motif-containing protein
MRTRFAAFAMKDAEYLVRTMHADHEERALPRETLLRILKASASTHKYMGLSILDTREPDDRGIARVLFLANLFEKGRDRSFVELSEFAYDGEGWRYLRGTMIPIERVEGDASALTIDRFPRE